MRRILIVDELVTARAIRRVLELRFGPSWPSTTHTGVLLAIDVATGSEGALRLLQRRPDAEPYHVAIVDTEQLTFEELAFLLHVARGRFAELRTLLLGARGDDHLAELAPQVGAHAALSKPLDLGRIVDTLRLWIVPPGAIKAG